MLPMCRGARGRSLTKPFLTLPSQACPVSVSSFQSSPGPKDLDPSWVFFPCIFLFTRKLRALGRKQQTTSSSFEQDHQPGPGSDSSGFHPSTAEEGKCVCVRACVHVCTDVWCVRSLLLQPLMTGFLWIVWIWVFLLCFFSETLSNSTELPQKSNPPKADV